MSLKDTLNLPDADFTVPMRADLPNREPEIQARWAEQDVYGLLQELRQDAEPFLLHDGPPYTNSPIHLGTALNKILKDFVLKSRLVMGHRVPYVPGYDNHGLPIEQAVMKTFQEKGVTPTQVELRRACREHARKYIDLQTEQFKRLGIFGMWDRPYTTMDYRFEAEIVRVFKRLVEGGYVYRGLRPVLWSPTAQTALADTEIVYQEVTSKAIHVAFPLPEPSGPLAGLENVAAVIWTTTPWTIPANLALAFHPEKRYAAVQVGARVFLVLEGLIGRVAEACGWGPHQMVRSFAGREVEGLLFKHPVYGRDSLAVLADYVTDEDGTGIVHTAPGHGRDDFATGAKYGLQVLCPVDARGILTEEAGEFAGTHYKKCDVVVVERLRELGALLAEADYRHSYPHAERDGNPVIFRATEQWFVSIDHAGLRDKAVSEIDQKVEWFPRSGQNRLRGMVQNRPDWCVSRQRPWGVGIPVFYGADSGEPVLDPVAIEAVAQLVETEGSDAWYEKGPAQILPPGYQHPQTGETEFRKEVDVFDVWFDSGSTQFAVMEGRVEPRWKERLPADVYLEGSDQHRGWFNVSLLLGIALRGAGPYQAVVTHGFVTDEKGQKMSKRLGNIVDPVAVCDQYGADVLRYWAASVNYEDDVPCSDALLKVAGENYRSVRNTLRFLLGNLADYDGSVGEPSPLDRWIVWRVGELEAQALDLYRRYQFNDALALVHSFCVNEVSLVYADFVKDRMYCDAADSPRRRAAQAASLAVLQRLVLLVAPVVPHTAEEVYARMPVAERKPTVFAESCPGERFEKVPEVEAALAVREWVFAALETWRAASGVKDSQDVQAWLTVSADEAAALAGLGDDLAVLFKLAGVDVQVGERHAEFRVSEWPKCDRSRLRRADVAPAVWQGETVLLSARDRRVLGL
jgi:isoleucyl-tRNA synthetase